MDDVPNIEESSIQGTGIVSDLSGLTTKRSVIKRLWLDDTQYVPLIDECLKSPEKVTIWDIISMLIKLSGPAIRFIYYTTKLLITIKDGSMTQNTIDTFKGVIRAILAILAVLGVALPTGAETTILSAVVAIWGLVELILGLLSHSNKVSPPKTP